jgi:cation diffusion facilitator CzcD-associated flavoprotein CzcO
MNGNGLQHTPHVAIIGSGFGGLGMAVNLMKAGFASFTLFEKAADVGGVWRDNTYPGAACDVPSHLYSFSFEPGHPWSRRYAPQAEILAYLKRCASTHGLDQIIRFDTEIACADFDDARGIWTLRATSGETFQADVLVTACGQLNRPAFPPLPGRDAFRGDAFHSARWNHRVDLTGKRVGVVGTGASAIQLVPPVAEQAGRLHLFQRSAPYVFPKPDRAYGRLESTLFDRVPRLQVADRLMQYCSREWLAAAFTSAKGLMAVPEWQFRRHLEQEIADPALRAKLTPDYPMGCKRVLLSNEYYPALTRSNVEVVTEAIAEIVPSGVRTRDGTLRELDALVYATGFTATDFLAPMAITGRKGRDLNQAWRDGAEAYLGVMVSGFPNLFMLYGPNTNLAHTSIVYMLESQIHFVLRCLERMRGRDGACLEVRADAQAEYNARLQRRIHDSVWETGCTSWYKTESGKNTNNWPGFTLEYRLRTRRPNGRHVELTQARP